MASNNETNNNPIAGAITYPQREAESAHAVPVQPRQPRNLQGLLRFALEATKAEDAPGNSEIPPSDPERLRFLQEALLNTTTNVTDEIKNCIKVLTNSEEIQSVQQGAPLSDDVERAFNNLRDYVCDVDYAIAFYKLGGFAMFPICYGSENEELRAQTSCILGDVCQNNPWCQERTLECGLLDVLLNFLQTEQGNALSKCLYALSCATRAFPAGKRVVITQGGCETLQRLLTVEDNSVLTRAAFYVCYLCRNDPEAKEQFIKHNIVKTITERIKICRDETTEHLLAILLALCDGRDPTVILQFRNQRIDLLDTLQRNLKHPDLQDDQYQEEKECCKELISLIEKNFPDDGKYEEVADR